MTDVSVQTCRSTTNPAEELHLCICITIDTVLLFALAGWSAFSSIADDMTNPCTSTVVFTPCVALNAELS